MFVLRRQIGALDVETHLAVKIGQQRQYVLTWIRMINDDRKTGSSEDASFCVVVGLECHDMVLMRSEYSQAFASFRYCSSSLRKLVPPVPIQTNRGV